MRNGFERYHDDIVLFSRTSIKTGSDRLKMSLNSLLRLPSRLLSDLSDLLDQWGKVCMLSLVRLGYKNACSFLLGLLEHLSMLLISVLWRSPRNPVGRSTWRGTETPPTDSQQNSQLTTSTILPDGKEPSWAISDDTRWSREKLSLLGPPKLHIFEQLTKY